MFLHTTYPFFRHFYRICFKYISNKSMSGRMVMIIHKWMVSRRGLLDITQHWLTFKMVINFKIKMFWRYLSSAERWLYGARYDFNYWKDCEMCLLQFLLWIKLRVFGGIMFQGFFTERWWARRDLTPKERAGVLFAALQSYASSLVPRPARWVCFWTLF